MTRSNRKYRFWGIAAATLLVAGTVIFARRNDFGLGRTMEITVNMMRELSLGYVDPIDADRLLEGAAAGMVRDLDPYTEFFSEEGMSATHTPMSRRGWKGSAPAEALIPEVNTRSASKTAICSVSGSIMSKVGSSSRRKYMAE